jgi:hypothetical protein
MCEAKWDFLMRLKLQNETNLNLSAEKSREADGMILKARCKKIPKPALRFIPVIIFDIIYNK